MIASRYSIRHLTGRFVKPRALRLHPRAPRIRWSVRRPVVGAEVHDGALVLACVHPGIGRRWIAGTDVIADYAGLQPEELRAQLRKRLGKWGASDPLIVLGWPRRHAIVRHLELPAAAERTLDEALRLQAGMFRPNEEVEFCSDAAAVREGARLAASLVLLPRAGLESEAGKFAQAGFPVSRFTLSSFALADFVLRTAPGDRPTRFLLIRQNGRETELAAFEGRALVFSRSLLLPAEGQAAATELLGAVEEALAGLRWSAPQPLLLAGSFPPEIETALEKAGPLRRLRDWVPGFGQPPENGAPGAADAAEDFWGALALAVEGSEWLSSYRLNLLPAELRQRRRLWLYLPTYVLVGVNALLLLALGLRGPIERRVLLGEYQRSIAGFQRPAARAERELATGQTIERQLHVLAQFQTAGRQPLVLLSNLAKQLPPDAWLTFFNDQAGHVEIIGSAKSATAVLSSLQALPDVEDVKFAGAVTRDSSGREQFRIDLSPKGKP